MSATGRKSTARTPKQIATAAVIAAWPGVTTNCSAVEVGDHLERWANDRIEGPLDHASEPALLGLAARCLIESMPPLGTLVNRHDLAQRLGTFARNQLSLARQAAIADELPGRSGG